MRTIPVVILNYNQADLALLLAEDVLGQEQVQPLVVFVDNASADGHILCNWATEHNAVYLQAEANKGYSAGNNIGLRYAYEQGYPYAIIANPDMRLTDKLYLHKLTQVLDNQQDTVVVGSDIINADGKHINPFFAPQAESGYCNALTGCAIALRLSFMHRNDYLDEYPFLYCEEVILAEQVRRAGKKMYYLADTQALHNHIESVKTNTQKIALLRHWRRSRLYYIDTYAPYGNIAKAFAKAYWWGYITLLILKAKI